MGDNRRFLRQQDVVDTKILRNLRVTLIGAGAIGSTTALWLAKMGVRKLTIFDHDIVEDHNQSNQLYQGIDVGVHKAVALQEIILMFEGFQVEVFTERYTEQSLTEVVISGVDSMAARKAIWKSVRAKQGIKLYIDARMGLKTLMVHAVDPTYKEERIAYSETLYSDEQALQEPCTARTICYTPLMAASIVCNLVKRYACQQSLPRQVTLDLATFTILTQGL